MRKKSTSASQTTQYTPYVLPSGFDEMDSFIEKNKDVMTEQVVSSIEYALEKHIDIIEVFTFKDSNFVITLSYENFNQNLNNVYSYYIRAEKYEYCTRIKKLQLKLNTISYKLNTNEKK
jgi:hypothetical protein